MTERFHQPAFPDDVVWYAETAQNGVLFDCYGGDAGYGELLLEKYLNLRYYYFDLDDTAIITATKRLGRFQDRVSIKKQDCRYIDKRIDDEGLNRIDCVIYDPGLRLEYIQNPVRGFVVNQSGPLDGRFNQDDGITIGEFLEKASKEEILSALKIIDTPFPDRISTAIVERRQILPITTTTELADIVIKSVPYTKRHQKIAPLVMLAMRIHVNDELNALKEALHKGFDALRAGGRLITISYHSGEARIFKTFAKRFDERYADNDQKRIRVLTRKAVKASEEQIRQNPQIRAAQLRVYEKLI